MMKYNRSSLRSIYVPVPKPGRPKVNSGVSDLAQRTVKKSNNTGLERLRKQAAKALKRRAAS
jgi:hypothetical protein